MERLLILFLFVASLSLTVPLGATDETCTEEMMKRTPVRWKDVTIDDAFWAPRIRTNREVTLPIEYRQCKETGRIDAFRLDYKPGQPNPPHIFWDSDVAKWVEACGYSLATHPDPQLQTLLDEVTALIVGAQQPDGYLNCHFTVVEPEKRWSNLRDWHELYCAGHLMEAAVACSEGTGDRRLLNALCRYADLIGQVFGRGEGQKRGYCGHEEIELALFKLYRATGEERYFRLAQYFIEERGQQPHYFDLEAQARGEEPGKFWAKTYAYNQSHLPVREQTEVVGHAVRAMYLYSGMADLAAETGDKTLLAACKRLWRDLIAHKLYITGGVGASGHGEKFSAPYDLPNETAYAETCAAIGLVFWAHRMLLVEPDREYADVMERALYNGVLSGVSLDGAKFFYTNPLAVVPTAPDETRGSVKCVRQDWFGCACCPPNIARLLASLGQYVYATSPRELYVHLYVQGTAKVEVAGTPVQVTQETQYPWDGKVRLVLSPQVPSAFALALRLPGWCVRPSLKVNGRRVDLDESTRRGYARIKRTWSPGDRVDLDLPMPVQRIEADPRVRHNCGRVALQRGPIVYCLEEVDNGPALNDLALPRRAKLEPRFEPDLLGGVVVLKGKGLRRDPAVWKDSLYRPGPSRKRAVPVVAVPYSTWCNRKPGEMLVWVREAE